MCSDLADMVSLTSIFRHRFQTKAFLQPGLWSCLLSPTADIA